jgi:alpha-beta hydrolase superfamily lysophospholipase
MKTKTFFLKADDGANINMYKWEQEDSTRAKGVVQIVHGMVEHAGRYEYFAKALTERGYIVYANDHRGHGKTAENKEELGHLYENGWSSIVGDVYALSLHIIKENPETALFLFGHSMGSFIARDYISEYGGLLKGVIICGTGYTPDLMVNVGIALSNREVKKYGQRHRSQFINKLVFSSNNKKFKPAKTEFDWLSREAEEVDKYIKDDLCGGICTSSFYNNLFRGLKKIQAVNTVDRIPKELPVLMISGEADPVGSNGRAVQKLYKIYKQAGLKDLESKIYKESRHELLNETNKNEVIEDVIEWIDGHIHYSDSL